MDQLLITAISNPADDVEEYTCVLCPNNKDLLYGNDYALKIGANHASAIKGNRGSIDICTRTA